jgi:hypothetical protein
MEIHFLPVLVCAVISMVLGMLWYGPIFGKAWMRVIKADPDCMTDPVKRKEANKKAMPLYLLQFLLALVQIWTLSKYISLGAASSSGLATALCLWVGFVLPTVAGGAMWSGDSRKDAWNRFFLTAGFQLLLFLVFGLILNAWR